MRIEVLGAPLTSIKNECADQFVAERHLEYLIREYEDYYNTSGLIRGLRIEPSE